MKGKAYVMLCAALMVCMAPAPDHSPIHIEPLSSMHRLLPTVPAKLLRYSIWHNAPIEIAKIFGRSIPCSNTDSGLVQEVADAAFQHHIDPRLAASVVVQESTCNPLAVSGKGAVGLIQIHVDTWKDKYDFSEKNLFNPTTNLDIGFTILSGLIDKYGEKNGLARYQGLGEGGNPNYVSQVIARK